MSSNNPLYRSNQIQIHGISGWDLISLLGVLELCEVEGGFLRRLSNGYTLLRDVSSVASAVPPAFGYSSVFSVTIGTPQQLKNPIILRSVNQRALSL